MYALLVQLRALRGSKSNLSHYRIFGYSRDADTVARSSTLLRPPCAAGDETGGAVDVILERIKDGDHCPT